jgi:peptidoglycan/LPS O-acetylase OafA/YrhL
MATKVFFPNLNSLRFIAALIVIVGHIEQYKDWLGLPFRQGYSYIESKLGVILFFVLSGFLITYLLLVEQKQEGDISIKDFYLRRVFRIWPLYFFIVILTLLVVPNIAYFELPNLDTSNVFQHMGWVVLLMLLILPNVVLTSFGIVPYGNQTWSIGSEEQFYLIWPVLMKYLKNKWILIISTIVIYHTVRYSLNHLQLEGFAKGFRGFWNTFHVDIMAVGAAFALIHFKGYNFITKVISHWSVQAIAWLGLAVAIWKGLWFGFFHYQVFAVLFGIVIYNLATNAYSLIKLEFAPLNYLGKISYGLYMYHPFAIVIAIHTCQAMGYSHYVVLYPLAIALTVGISAVSYRFLETPFMSMKKKYTRVESGS